MKTVKFTEGKEPFEIMGAAFMNNTKLESIVLPKNARFGGNAWGFYGCGLKSVTSKAETAYPIMSAVFSGEGDTDSYTTATLYVPLGSKKNYEEVEYWNRFENIVEVDITSIIRGDIDGDNIVNGSDIIEVMNFIMGKDSKATPKSADVNGDGVVNVADIVEIVNIIKSEE